MFEKITRYLSKDSRSGVEILQADINRNPFYPFQLGLTYDDRSRVFTLRVPYREKFAGEVVGFLSGLAVLIFLVTNTQRNSVIFVYVIMVFIYSCAVIISYRNERIYILDEGTKTYSFVVGRRSSNGEYHNIYIRLNKEKIVGKPEKPTDLPRYHLVLDGVKIDRQTLTKKSSTNLKMLRKLGQRLAKNININYFDEANVSVFHVVRHWPNQETGVQ